MANYHLSTKPVFGCTQCRHDIKADDGSNAWALMASGGDNVIWTTSGAQIAFEHGKTPCSNGVMTITVPSNGSPPTPCVIDSGAKGAYDYSLTTSLVGIKCQEDPKIIIQPQGGLWIPLMTGILVVLVTAIVAYRIGRRGALQKAPA